jgi:MATE family multidrug resistance protein
MPMLLAAFAYWGVGMPLGATLGLGLLGGAPWGPRGMWAGLIAGLGVAAVLLCGRFARSSRPARIRAMATGQDGPVTSGP